MGPKEGLSLPLPVTSKCPASPRFVWKIICLTKVCVALLAYIGRATFMRPLSFLRVTVCCALSGVYIFFARPGNILNIGTTVKAVVYMKFLEIVYLSYFLK